MFEKIENYFNTDYEYRFNLIEETVKSISSVSEVLYILEWSKNKNCGELYDSIINLLSYCGKFTIEIIEKDLIKSSSVNVFDYEEKWDILIHAFSLAKDVDSLQKFEIIKNLIQVHKSRILKASIIDALDILDGEVDSNLIRDAIQYYLSENEKDEYIHDYAQETLDFIEFKQGS